ncbi:MAG TPA: glycosyltransferase [Chryseolinea sp.]|nr:glycosyltransferase [Chryseolinea sp.]
MRKLLIVTHIDFWRTGAGHSARLSSLVSYFKEKLAITVVFIGKFSDHDQATLTLRYPDISVHVLENRRVLTYKESRVLFEEYIKEKTFDVALIEYIELSFVLPSLSEHCITLLDTHDLVNDRVESFRRNNVPYDGIELTAEEEFDIFKCFDYVIAIQKSDYAKIVGKLPPSRTLLAPHPVNFSKKRLRQSVCNLAFIASGYQPNVDALTWFLHEVWPSLYEEYGVSFEVYGRLREKLNQHILTNSPGVHFHGFAADLGDVYEKCDLIVNPVRFGAGLKIKNVEAIGNGLPLVTTSHGAVGMEDAANTSFLVAETALDFKAAIGKLIKDFEFRTQIGDNAYRYAERFFSHDRCYRPLADIMLGVD